MMWNWSLYIQMVIWPQLLPGLDPWICVINRSEEQTG
jgi:hypothetical protein